MVLETIVSRAKKGGNTLSLFEITQSGMMVTVRSGGRCRAPNFEENTLEEDVEFLATSHATEIVYVNGWLVKEKATGLLDVFVDEIGGDLGPSRYKFDASSPYERVALLFLFQVPPAVSTLDDVKILLYRIEEDEE